MGEMRPFFFYFLTFVFGMLATVLCPCLVQLYFLKVGHWGKCLFLVSCRGLVFLVVFCLCLCVFDSLCGFAPRRCLAKCLIVSSFPGWLALSASGSVSTTFVPLCFFKKKKPISPAHASLRVVFFFSCRDVVIARSGRTSFLSCVFLKVPFWTPSMLTFFGFLRSFVELEFARQH